VQCRGPDRDEDGASRGGPVESDRAFHLAIAGMSLSFFLTLGLLQALDLSYLYPFQASSVISDGDRRATLPARDIESAESSRHGIHRGRIALVSSS